MCNLLLRKLFNKSVYFTSLRVRYLNSKIPKDPVSISIDSSKLPEPTKIDQEIVNQLERLSLVDFGNAHGIKILEDAIRFADQIHLINTNNIQPLFTVLENQ